MQAEKEATRRTAQEDAVGLGQVTKALESRTAKNDLARAPVLLV
eukprot:COSAG02_NODE_71700_length_190_cov_19.296703_1_plen_43_part_01